MKIRNKKLVNGVIAAFMVVLMTGAAFAFVSQGPLNFGGAAGVDSALALAITGSNHYGIGVDAELDLTVPVVAANGSGYRNAAMTVDFDGIGQSATYNFTVTNIGTLTAEIAPISLEFVPNSSQLLVWTQQGALETEGAILAPGEYVNFSFSVAFDAASVNNWYYSAVSGVSFVLNYGLVGSYVPEPGPQPPTLSGHMLYFWEGLEVGNAITLQHFGLTHNGFVHPTFPDGVGGHPLNHGFNITVGWQMPIDGEGYYYRAGERRMTLHSNRLAIVYNYEILIVFGTCPETGENAVTSVQFAVAPTAWTYPFGAAFNFPNTLVFEPFYYDLVFAPNRAFIPTNAHFVMTP